MVRALQHLVTGRTQAISGIEIVVTTDMAPKGTQVHRLEPPFYVAFLDQGRPAGDVFRLLCPIIFVRLFREIVPVPG
jgi:hypothetical protein